MGNRLVLHTDECEKLFFPERARLMDSMDQSYDHDHSPSSDGEASKSCCLARLGRKIIAAPHRLSHSWLHVNAIMLWLILGTLVFHASIFLMPLHNVNGGLRENRRFLYGVQSHVELIALIPWIETVHFAIPSAKIPLRSRLIAILVGLLVAKFFDAFIAEGWWGGPHADPVFPIPFSTVVSMTLSLPFSLTTLYYLTPTRSERIIREKFAICYRVLGYYLGCLFAAGCWAVGMRHFFGRPIFQFVWAFLFDPIRLICKIYFLSGWLLKLNPRRWVPMVIVVDVIFGRVQVATLPYFGSFGPVIAVVLGTCATLIWRFYSGVDRIQLIWKRFTSSNQSSEHVDMELGLHGARRVGIQSCVHLPHRIMRASLKDIHRISMRLHGNQTFDHWAQRMDDELDDDSTIVSAKIHGSLPSLPHLSSDDDEEANETFCIKTSDGTESVDSEHSMVSVHLVEEDEQHVAGDDDTTGSSETIKSSHVTVAASESIALETNAAVFSGDTETGTRPIMDSPPSTIQVESSRHGDVTNDRRLAFQQRFARPSAAENNHSKLHEVDWEQRQMFHVVDSIGAEVLIIIVRIHHMVTIGCIRHLPVSQHLNRTFEITDEQWSKANIFGWTFVVANIFVILTLSLAFRQIQRDLGPDRPLTLNRVLTYVFRNHFWFFFLWLSVTGALACSTMINHFGADFRLTFKWLSCRGEGRMNWPGCMM